MMENESSMRSTMVYFDNPNYATLAADSTTLVAHCLSQDEMMTHIYVHIR